MNINKMNIRPAVSFKDQVVALLLAENLPVIDLPDSLDDFLVATTGDIVQAVAGLGIHGKYGLLRSVAVAKGSRKKGMAAALIKQIETIAKNSGLEIIYLLTETATEYFNKQGYEQVSRMDIPEEIKVTSQFNTVCPKSATAMVKNL